MMRRKFARCVQVGFGGKFLGLACRKLRLRLRHVGWRDNADAVAVARLLQGLFEHPRITALNLQDRRIAQIVHVDGGRRKQNRLFQQTQGLARAEHLAFSGAGLVCGLIAVEERLGRGKTHGVRPLRSFFDFLA